MAFLMILMVWSLASNTPLSVSWKWLVHTAHPTAEGKKKKKKKKQHADSNTDQPGSISKFQHTVFLDLHLELILWLITHSILLCWTLYDIGIFFGYVNTLHQWCWEIWVVFRRRPGNWRVPELHEKCSLIYNSCASRCGRVYRSSRRCRVIYWKLWSITYYDSSWRNCLALGSLSSDGRSRHNWTYQILNY